MALSLKKQIERAVEARTKTVDAVYAAAYPRRDVRFSECLAMANEDVRAAYLAADAKVTGLEIEAICASKAWRSTTGVLYFNR